MDTEASRKLILDYYAAQESGDPEAVRALLSEDLEWIPPQSAPFEPTRGRDQVLTVMAEAGAQLFDTATMVSSVRKIVADGDTVIVLSSMQCKAANGRDYDNRYVWVFVCEDGRIARMEEHVDTLRFQRIVLDP